jgi:hypothetical protein
MSVVEGMAAGCVPVVSRCGGPWFDILDCKQGVYGFSYRSVGGLPKLLIGFWKTMHCGRAWLLGLGSVLDFLMVHF